MTETRTHLHSGNALDIFNVKHFSFTKIKDTSVPSTGARILSGLVAFVESRLDLTHQEPGSRYHNACASVRRGKSGKNGP